VVSDVNAILKTFRLKLVKQFLELVILKYLIKQKKVSGYDLLKQINEDYGILLSPGTIYSKLYSLERKGFIRGEWAEKRREYTITQKGRLAINDILSDSAGKKFLKLIEKPKKVHAETTAVQE